ncbi:MAG: tRNA (N6-isopentenyl adenosine(37)-C2)-methylthiotransferase MiaB [Planctomycetes bacterium]|nr:tRNA (N6-isopentenyl adenosine(37)-C2)-methylthiotransferase MiaB [Planctomycetota bacterium]
MAGIYIETYGCQMNEYDSELVKTILHENHHDLHGAEEDADVILLNTCAVRENAFNKIFSRVGNLKHLRRSHKVKVGILGCMAQNIKNKLLENPNIDFCVGPDNYRELPELIQKSLGKTKNESSTRLSKEETYSDVQPTREDSINAWIAIMRGCDNFCTFCVVPFTRGRERSRSVESIVSEATQAVKEGKKQVTLLGQNVNSYKNGEDDFCTLIEAVSEVKGLQRIRFTSPHPKDFPDHLLHLIAQKENICKQIHLPLQAGNTEVLTRMKRDYSREEFLHLAQKMRKLIPGVSLSTDIIVGFPGERDDQFEDTASLMEEVRFDSAYIFKYSPREGTYALKHYPDDVHEDEKKRRIIKLNEMQRKHTTESLSRMLGLECEVLVEREETHLSKEQCQGRTDQGTTVVIPQNGSLKCGDQVRVIIKDKTAHVLIGELIS